MNIMKLVGKHFFPLVMHGFCSNNALSMAMFIFLTPEIVIIVNQISAWCRL